MCVAQMPNWSREVLQDVLSDALSQAWTPAQEAVLSNEAGMETVIDAVGRVNAAAQVLPWLVCSNLSSTFFDSHVCHLQNSGVMHAMVLTKSSSGITSVTWTHAPSSNLHGHVSKYMLAFHIPGLYSHAVHQCCIAPQVCHSHALPCTSNLCVLGMSQLLKL